MIQWTLLWLLLLPGSIVFSQALVPSYAPEDLSKQLIKLAHSIESCSSVSPCNSPQDETLGRLILQAEDLGKELGIGMPVSHCLKIASAHTLFDGIHESGYVRMQCGEDLILVIVTNSGSHWERLQTLTIRNKHWSAHVLVKSVTGDNSQQILVHMAQYQSGTGINQQNFLVYKLKDGKFIDILNLVEVAYLNEPWTQHSVSQKSVFVFQKPTASDNPPAFNETQTLELSGIIVELKRKHDWSEQEQKFVATQWYSGRRLAPQKKVKKN